MNDFDLPVDDHMLSAVRTIRDNARLSVAARMLEELGISALPVQDASGRLTGVLEGADLKRASRFTGREPGGTARWSLPDGFVAEWMRTVVPIVSRGQTLRECARRMVERGVRHLYVVDDRELCGVLGTREVMRAVARARLESPLADLVRPARAVAASAPASEAAAQWSAGKERPLVVVDGDAEAVTGHAVVGVFGRTEMLSGLEASPTDATSLWMDPSLVVLPASTPVHVAAEQALGARARYVVARSATPAVSGGAAFHVITSPVFAACIVGERASAIPPAPSTEPPLASATSHLSGPASTSSVGALRDEERRPRPFSVPGSGAPSAPVTAEREPAREREARGGGGGGGGSFGKGDPRTR